ncbi:hypothetical protein ACLOJK_032808 [Asimina triloba]
MAMSSASLLLSRTPTSLRNPSSSLSSSNSVFFGHGMRNSYGKQNSSLVLQRRRSSHKRLNCRCLFGLGVPELAVIAGAVLLVFGPSKLPEVGKTIGKTFKGFQQAAKEFETELQKPSEDSVGLPEEEATAVNGSDKQDLESAEVDLPFLGEV